MNNIQLTQTAFQKQINETEQPFGGQSLGFIFGSVFNGSLAFRLDKQYSFVKWATDIHCVVQLM